MSLKDILKLGEDAPEQNLNGYSHHQLGIKNDGAVAVAAIAAIADLSTEELLRQSQELMTGIINSTNDLIIAIDRSFNITALNGSARSTIKSSYGIDLAVGASVFAIIPQADHEARRALYERVFDGESVPSEPLEMSLAGGLMLYYETSYYAVSAADGDITGVAIFTRDITARRRAEVTQLDRETRLRKQQAAQTALAKSAVIASGNLTGALQEITQTAVETLSVMQAGVWFFNDRRDAIVAANLYTAQTRRHSVGTELHQSDFPVYFAEIESGRILAAEDACADARTSEFHHIYFLPRGISSMLDVPVRHNGAVIGVICLEHAGEKRVWTIDEQNFAASLADTLAQTLQARDRQAAEDKLRQSEERYAVALTGSQSGLWDWNLVTNAVYFSPLWKEMLGYQDRELENSFDTFVRLVHPKDLPALRRTIDDYLAERIPAYESELRMQCKDRSWRWILAKGVCLRDDTGKAVRFVGSHLDITERKEAEGKLRDSEAQLQQFMNAIPAGIFVIDRAGKPYFANAAARNLLGKGIMPTDGVGSLAEVYRAYQAGTTAEYPVTNMPVVKALLGMTSMIDDMEIEREGVRVPLEVRATPVVNEAGDLQYAIAVFQDISERREAERKVRDSEEKFRKTAAAVPGMIYQFVMMPDGTMMMPLVSDGCQDLFEVAPETVIAEPMTLFAMMSPDTAADAQRAIAASAETLRQFELDIPYTLGSGAKKWTRWASQPERLANGGTVWHGIVMDITEQKRLETELAARLQEIQETQSHLIQSEKMSSLGQMVAGIAHELNTPIGYASSNVSLIKTRFNELSSLLRTALEAHECVYAGQLEAAFKKIQTIRSAPDGTLAELNETVQRTARLFTGVSSGFEQMTSLVKSMRNFSRLDEADMKKADLNEGLRGCLLMVGHLLKDKNVDLTTDYNALPLLDCFPAQLNQVFLNLITNAIDAVEDKPDAHVHVRTEFDGADVYVRVIDNGNGIPKHVQAKIFDPFFTTKPVGKGTGLGLSISYSIVQKHNGILSFDSKVGTGTTFTVKIPAVEFLSSAV